MITDCESVCSSVDELASCCESLNNNDNEVIGNDSNDVDSLASTVSFNASVIEALPTPEIDVDEILKSELDIIPPVNEIEMAELNASVKKLKKNKKVCVFEI